MDAPLISNLYARATLATVAETSAVASALHCAGAAPALSLAVYSHGVTLAQVGMTGGMVGEAL